VHGSIIDAVHDYQTQTFEMKRPPLVSSHILALIVLLHKQRREFPTRHFVAEQLGCSVWGVDSAINTAKVRCLIETHMTTAPGSIQRRENVTEHRHYVPSPELVAVVERAQRRINATTLLRSA
jgi:hypothetical protein